MLRSMKFVLSELPFFARLSDPRRLVHLFTLTFTLSSWGADKPPVDWVDPLIGSATSRWIFFSSACRPFGMVNLSPDTQTGKDWGGGYLYGDHKVRCFSHIDGWQLYGVAVMPVSGEMNGPRGMDAYASEFTHSNEVVRAGYHKLVLDTYGITAELTATTRVGVHRYTFPKDQPAHILFDTGATLMDKMGLSEVRRINDKELAGYAVMAPTSRRPKPFTVYFVARLSLPFSRFGGWTNGLLQPAGGDVIVGSKAGAFVSFATPPKEPVVLKVAISYTSVASARANLEAEMPHWDFDRVVRESRDDWNQWLGRLEVTGGTEAQRTKFYTDLWHALLGRRIVSDADGSYCDMTGSEAVVRKVALAADGRPLFPHHNFDALWGSQWNLNLLWSFAYPEVMDAFCNTMVDMYRDGGLIPRGPSGGNYTFVMVGDPATAFFAAAYNKGIRHYDAAKAFEGLRKNALPGGIRDHAGYEHAKNALGGGMKYYVERGYVPENIEGAGMHKDGAAMTMEYAYYDWCLAQLARGLGKEADAEWLLKRASNYTNLWDGAVKFIHPRLKDGSWLPNFEAMGPKAAKGFCEANSAIYTHYVPHDVPGLMRLFGGPAQYVAALDRQFELAAAQKFLAQHGKHELQWVDYDNEPSMAMAHLFNRAGAPWLSQKWVRAVLQEAYGETSPFGGYNGDEDQGQMGGLAVLMAIGLFDVEGGASVRPTYQVTSPVFDRTIIHLSEAYFPGKTFTITTRGVKPENVYIQSARLNGRALNQCWFDHSELVRGGTLDLELGAQPNRGWGQ